jgi:hypothetical protein
MPLLQPEIVVAVQDVPVLMPLLQPEIVVAVQDVPA